MYTVPEDQPSPSSSSYASSEFDGHQTSRKVYVSDDELVRRACIANRTSRSGRLLRTPSLTWDCKEVSGFALLSRRVGADSEGLEVLTTGEVACRPRDLVSLLRSQSECDYNAIARGFLGNQFIYGSIVHEVATPQVGSVGFDEEHFGNESLHQLAVRTACFARSRRFARNEQWCFLEHFQPNPASPMSSSASYSTSSASSSADGSTGFTIVYSSLPEHELKTGKTTRGRVTQLHGITATYLVEPLPQTVGCRGPRVRVTFHATFNAAETVREGYADAETVRSRLLALAKSVHRLPELVRQRQCTPRRLGSPSDRGNQGREARNSHCIACTKRLRLRLLATPTRKTKRCQICAYNVCLSCWSLENVATANGHATTMAVCRRCHENMGTSDYSHIHLTQPVEVSQEY
ncbi:hypothetical protein BBJ28_00020698 [Nothophytophthora sp. Chile5]|nr:hypothetical protein BBJ28_00020698 [Nothophytophthora sp. Chile5]